MGTNVYLKSKLHEEIVRRGLDVGEFVNEAVKKELFGFEYASKGRVDQKQPKNRNT